MSRIVFVDALRGLAALAVVCHHYNEHPRWPIFVHGDLGVPVFFVLSGFVIAMSIGTQPMSLSFLGRFALRRSIRLDPPYWLSIALVVAIGVVGARHGLDYTAPSIGQVTAHLLYLQSVFHFEPLQPTYWTLCYEAQFYLFLILLCYRPGALGWTLLATLVLSILDRRFEVTSYAFMGRFWFCFSAGALAYYATQSNVKRPYFIAALCIVIAYGALRNDRYALVAGFTAWAIYAVVAFDLRQLGASAPLQFLGRISYSLYLTHLIFGWLALRVAERYVPLPLAFLFGIAVAITAAWAFYLIVERPSALLSKRVSVTDRDAEEVAQAAPIAISLRSRN